MNESYHKNDDTRRKGLPVHRTLLSDPRGQQSWQTELATGLPRFFFGTSTKIQQRSPALGIMIVFTIAALIDPARMAEADAALMMMYGSLSALVGAYFGFSSVAAKR